MSDDSSSALNLAGWRCTLAEACRAVEGASGPVVVCLTGPAGAGKTTLGREIRKKGLPGYSRRGVMVIDDGVTTIPVLGFFQRRFHAKSDRRDNLAPFARWMAGKSVVVYVAIRPWERLDHCDVLLRVHCSAAAREKRQAQRGKGYLEGLVSPPDDWIGAARVVDLTTG
jgi:hypothetical protein